jgi:hypothetical protein
MSGADLGLREDGVFAIPGSGLAVSAVRSTGPTIVGTEPLHVIEAANASFESRDRSIEAAAEAFAEFIKSKVSESQTINYCLVIGDGLYVETAGLLDGFARVLKRLKVNLIIMKRSEYESRRLELISGTLVANLVDEASLEILGEALEGKPVLAVGSAGKGDKSFKAVLAVMALMGLASSKTADEFIYYFGPLMGTLGHPINFESREEVAALQKFDLLHAAIVRRWAVLRELPLGRALSAARMAIQAVVTAA